MQIKLHEIPIREIVSNYLDSGDAGVVGYGGKLNIRPAYQREFIYDVKQRDAVMDTILKGFPLNVMYWCKNNDDEYEILDGQQRTVSFSSFCANEYMITYNGRLKTFQSMSEDEKNKILDYKCMIYICEGTDSEKLDWFRVINTAGEKLYEQELRNACYTGRWLTDAKIRFSKNSCPAYQMANKLMNGVSIRQDYLETALRWIIDSLGIKTIEEYMLMHQQDYNAIELWNYFTNVINWVKAIFPKYRKEMKGIEWGILYNKFHTNIYDPIKIEEEVSMLYKDDEVENKKGIYYYIFTREEKNLNLRTFSDSQKAILYERQNGICPKCNHHFDISEMQGDHILAWSRGGKTELSNGQMLCRKCNGAKSNH